MLKKMILFLKTLNRINIKPKYIQSRFQTVLYVLEKNKLLDNVMGDFSCSGTELGCEQFRGLPSPNLYIFSSRLLLPNLSIIKNSIIPFMNASHELFHNYFLSLSCRQIIDTFLDKEMKLKEVICLRSHAWHLTINPYNFLNRLRQQIFSLLVNFSQNIQSWLPQYMAVLKRKQVYQKGHCCRAWVVFGVLTFEKRVFVGRSCPWC